MWCRSTGWEDRADELDFDNVLPPDTGDLSITIDLTEVLGWQMLTVIVANPTKRVFAGINMKVRLQSCL
jgi:hypothetical protein